MRWPAVDQRGRGRDKIESPLGVLMALVLSDSTRRSTCSDGCVVIAYVNDDSSGEKKKVIHRYHHRERGIRGVRIMRRETRQ